MSNQYKRIPKSSSTDSLQEDAYDYTFIKQSYIYLLVAMVLVLFSIGVLVYVPYIVAFQTNLLGDFSFGTNITIRNNLNPTTLNITNGTVEFSHIQFVNYYQHILKNTTESKFSVCPRLVPFTSIMNGTLDATSRGFKIQVCRNDSLLDAFLIYENGTVVMKDLLIPNYFELVNGSVIVNSLQIQNDLHIGNGTMVYNNNTFIVDGSFKVKGTELIIGDPVVFKTINIDNNGNTALLIQTSNNNTFVDSIYISESGWVGIGTKNPQAPFEVVGDVRAKNVYIDEFIYVNGLTLIEYFSLNFNGSGSGSIINNFFNINNITVNNFYSYNSYISQLSVNQTFDNFGSTNFYGPVYSNSTSTFVNVTSTTINTFDINVQNSLNVTNNVNVNNNLQVNGNTNLNILNVLNTLTNNLECNGVCNFNNLNVFNLLNASTIIVKNLYSLQSGVFNDINVMQSAGFNGNINVNNATTTKYLNSNQIYTNFIQTNNLYSNRADLAVCWSTMVGCNYLSADTINVTSGNVDDLNSKKINTTSLFASSLFNNIAHSDYLTSIQITSETINSSNINTNFIQADGSIFVSINASYILAESVMLDSITSKDASINDLNSMKINASFINTNYMETQSINSKNANIDDINNYKLNSTFIYSTNAEIDQIKCNIISANQILLSSINISTAQTDQINANTASFTDLNCQKSNHTYLHSDVADIEFLYNREGSINNLRGSSLVYDTINSMYSNITNIDSKYSNIDDINSVKINSTTIYTKNLFVESFNFDNLNVNTLNATNIYTNDIQSNTGTFQEINILKLNASAVVSDVLTGRSLNTDTLNSGYSTLERIYVQGVNESLLSIYSIDNERGSIKSKDVIISRGGLYHSDEITQNNGGNPTVYPLTDKINMLSYAILGLNINYDARVHLLVGSGETDVTFIQGRDCNMPAEPAGPYGACATVGIGGILTYDYYTLGGYNFVSSQLVKENITDTPIQKSYTRITGLEIKDYNFKKEFQLRSGKEASIYTSPIAEQTELFYPNSVSYKEMYIGGTYKSVPSIDYSQIISDSVNVIKDLKSRIEALEQMVNSQAVLIQNLLIANA